MCADGAAGRRGTVFDIQRFCLHDGPGIRTTVFFKGCPLRCRWCANPESQESGPQLLFSAEKCVGCGACKAACPGGRDPVLCRGKGCPHSFICTEVCPTEACRRAGEEMDAGEVVDQVLRDEAVYRSGGGMTVGGGEPFAQPDYLKELLTRCRAAGLTTCVETCAQAPWEAIEACLPHLDHILCDIKHTDPETHRAWTGVSSRGILERITKLSRWGGDLTLRIPVIPGFNTDEPSRRGFVEFLAGLPPLPVELLPYHVFGEKKYGLLGRPYPGWEIPVQDALCQAEKLRDTLSSAGIPATISQ